jgi:hypothetical protein
MHASIWRFRGDPDELLHGESMVTEIPASNMRVHRCPSAPDGIVLARERKRPTFVTFPA